eukprot:scaffold176809_cov21-Tisochrysis_lutea.AAC.2
MIDEKRGRKSITQQAQAAAAWRIVRRHIRLLGPMVKCLAWHACHGMHERLVNSWDAWLNAVHTRN